MLAEMMANHFIKFRKQAAAAAFEHGSVKQQENMGWVT